MDQDHHRHVVYLNVKTYLLTAADFIKVLKKNTKTLIKATVWSKNEHWTVSIRVNLCKTTTAIIADENLSQATVEVTVNWSHTSPSHINIHWHTEHLLPHYTRKTFKILHLSSDKRGKWKVLVVVRSSRKIISTLNTRYNQKYPKVRAKRKHIQAVFHTLWSREVNDATL